MTEALPYLFVPTSSPETNCFWKMKNTIAVGMAAMIDPAATTFHWLTNPPCRFRTPVIRLHAGTGDHVPHQCARTS